MSEKKKTKKVNQLNIKECEEILARLYNQIENKYYQDVLSQYRKLIPAHRYAIELGKIKDSKDATMPIIKEEVNTLENI